jgi:hypothetical protein
MSDPNDECGCAFPLHGIDGVIDYGASLRDYFAAKALNGMLAHSTRYKPRAEDSALHWHDACAAEAYDLADAMIRAKRR